MDLLQISVQKRRRTVIRKQIIFENCGVHCFSTPFGDIALHWWEKANTTQILRVHLTSGRYNVSQIAAELRRSALLKPNAVIEKLAADMRRFLKGNPVSFDLKLVEWSICTPFQLRVLQAESAVPRGCITTYGRLAAHLHKPHGAQPVGSVLANNPFPIIIPCHRAVAADGSLSGFQGGMKMKRSLLEMEGIEFDRCGRVRLNQLYY